MKKKLFVIALCAVLMTGCSFSKKEETKENKVDETKTETKVDTNENQNNNNVVETMAYTSLCGSNSGNVDVDTSKYTNIFDYILDQEDVKVVVNYYNDDLNLINKELNPEDAKKFLDNMKANRIDAVYGGGLGGAYVSTIDINYVRNGAEKNVNIYQVYALSTSNDMNIFKIIDENASKVVIDENATGCTYSFDNFDDEVYEIAKK